MFKEYIYRLRLFRTCFRIWGLRALLRVTGFRQHDYLGAGDCIGEPSKLVELIIGILCGIEVVLKPSSFIVSSWGRAPKSEICSLRKVETAESEPMHSEKPPKTEAFRDMIRSRFFFLFRVLVSVSEQRSTVSDYGLLNRTGVLVELCRTLCPHRRFLAYPRPSARRPVCRKPAQKQMDKNQTTSVVAMGHASRKKSRRVCQADKPHIKA